MSPGTAIAVICFVAVFSGLITVYIYRLLVDRLWLDVAVSSFRRYLADAALGPIHKSDLVLDIGSGDRPHPRADIICDRYEESWERTASLLRDRPLVLGDITALPFADKSIDFIFCQHVMEHMPIPGDALKELERVGKRGIVRTPSPLAEKFYARDVHRWLVSAETDSDGNLIVFRQKNDAITDQELTTALGGDAKFWHYFGKMISKMETTYVWDDKIRYRVDLLPNPDWDGEPSSADVFHDGMALGDENVKNKTARFSRQHFRQLATISLGSLYRQVYLRRPKNVDWTKILACPKCHGPVNIQNTIVCESCSLTYPYRNGLPVMIVPDATSIV